MSSHNVHALRPVARTSRLTPPTPTGRERNDFCMDPLSTRLDNYANILLTNHPTVSNPFDVGSDLPKRWEIERPCRKIQDSSGSYTLVNNSNIMSESVAIGQDVYKFDNMPKTLVGDLTDAVKMMHGSFYRIELSQLPIAQSLYNLTKWSNVYMRILLNLVKVPENCYRLGVSEIPGMFAGICLHVFSQKVKSWDQEAQKNAIKLVSYMIEFYDYLYDPLRLWRNHSTNQMKALDIVVEVPQLIEAFHLLFIDGLRQGWGPDTPEFAQLQIPLINIFGSAIFGSVSNGLAVLKPATVMAVLSFLSPDPVAGINVHFIGPILEIIVKIIHLTVSFKDQVGITNNIILRSYLELLNIQSLSQLGKEGFELLFCLLERIPNICSTNDKSIIQCEFEVAGIFTKMLDILDYETPMETKDNIKLYALVLEAITACLSACNSSKSAFEAFIGYNKLVRLVFKKVAPCEDVLAPLLLMVIERAYHEEIHHCVVQNVPLLLTLLDFTPELTGKLQIWFGHKLREICVQSSLSALKCSLEGITLKLLALVESVQEDRIQLEKETLESLFKILEFVGRHSITALELKQIISLMRVTADTKQPPYSARLVKCLEEIASKDGRIKAQSYFDLHDSDSGISLPNITWQGSAFTFHCWIFIDPTSQTIMSSPNHMVDSISTGLGNLAAFPIRRIVYSFLNSHDIGFEAFITPDCHLVIAVSTKKEYYTFEIRNFAFVDFNWHSLAVVHRKPKQILSDQSECVVYLNGVVCDRFVFRMPSLKDTFRSCHIGNRPGINPADVPNLIYPRQTKPHKFSEASTVCPINHQHEIWGYPGSLGGLLGSVVVFAEALTQQQIQLIHSKGTNDLSTFHSCPLTTELGTRLVVFYHPAACIEEKCQDLTPHHIYPDQKLTGKFKGQCYTTHDIRYIINHVGGVELLFPLLENVLLSQSVDYSKQQQQQQQQQLQESNSGFEEIATATGEFPLALGYKPGFRGSIYSNSVDNLATDSANKYAEKKSTSLDFLRSPLSPTLPRRASLFKNRLRRTISTPPPPKKEAGQSTPNLQTEKLLLDNLSPDRTLFNHNQYITKNSVPIRSHRDHGVSVYDSEEMLELNPKLKMLQKFPEILQANGDVDRVPTPAIKIQTMSRKPIPKSPSIKFSTLKDKSLFRTKPSTIFYEQLSASTPLTNTTINTTTTTTPTTPTRPIDNKNASIILASNPEDVHNFDTLTTYLTPSPSPTDPHKLTPSGFFRLLHAFLLHLPSNQQKFYDVIGPVTIAALLQKLHARMMGIDTFDAVRNLTHYLLQFRFDDANLTQDLLKNLVLDFKLWSRSCFKVRVEHLQLVCTYLKQWKDDLRCDYGIKYFLNVIRRYYTTDTTFTPRADQSDCVSITQEESECLVGALMNIVKFYMRDSLDKDEFDSILSFLVSVRDTVQLEALLRKIYQLLFSGEGQGSKQLAEFLIPHGHWLLVLLENDSPQARSLVLKVIMELLYTSSIRSSTLYQCVDNGNLNVALGRMYGLELNERLAGYLVSICISTESDSIVEYILNVDVLLTTMKLLRDASIMVRLRACQQVVRAMFHNPHHAKEIAKVPKWIYHMLHMLMKPRDVITPGDRPESPVQLIQRHSDNSIEEMFHCLTRIINVVMWYGVLRDRDSMAEWGIVFYALEEVSRENQMLFGVATTRNRLLYLLIDQATLQAEAEGESAQLIMRTLVISRLLETYIFGLADNDNNNNGICPETCNVHLLKLYFKLLSQLQIFLVCFTDIELIEIEHIALRVFLGCLSVNREDVYLTVSQLITPVITSGIFNLKSEVPFIIGSLHDALSKAIEFEDKQHQGAILLVMKQLFMSVTDYLLDDNLMPLLPKLEDNPLFTDDVTSYLTDEKYQMFLRENETMTDKYRSTVIIPSIEETRQALELAREFLQEHETHAKEYKKVATAKYVESILKPFYKLREEAREEMKNQDNKDSGYYYNALVNWKRLRTFYVSPQGVWSNRKTEEFIWKLEPTENFSRMHMKLIAAPGGTRHMEASVLRDNSRVAESQTVNPLGGLPIELERSNDPLFDLDPEIPLVDLPHQVEEAENAPIKKVQLKEKCQLILYMESIPGTVEVTNQYVQFVPDVDQEKKEVLNLLSNINIFPVFKWGIKKLREVHFRRYNLRKTSLEFFLLDQTNYLLNFEKKVMTRVYQAIMSLKPPKIRYADIRSPTRLLVISGLTDKWVRREISNFEYLMQINTIAGRTYNDFNQYPVFPWVIKDYTSSTLDPDNLSIYRDLSKPVGALNPKNEQSVKQRYEEFVDPSGELPKFHYGTHYSNAASVLHFLIRLEPFTTFHIDLQSGKFDHADRQFYSLQSTFQKCYDGLDVKELTPEFYYLPDMFENCNQLDLGSLQSNELRINDVILPPWSNSAEDFIVKHRLCLESEYVSSHLNEWIDLIFGYKQKGKEAERAVNVFYYCTYEGAVNLDKIKDPRERASYESMIKNFGQTPSKLFREPHPRRMSPEDALKASRHKIDLGETSQKRPPNLLMNFKNGLKAYCVEVCKEAIVFIGTQLVSCSLIYRGTFDHLVTVNRHTVCQTHQWLASSSSRKSHPFTFNLDPKAQLDRSHWCSLGGHPAPDIAVSSKLFAISQDGKLLISVGHWDKTIKVLRNQRQLSVIRQHHDIVTCISADRGGEHFITGSKDTTCKIWQLVDPGSSGTSKGIEERPLHTLYGQVTCVTAVAISVELDLAVSGARDGHCILYSMHQGVFIRCLQAPGGEVVNMSISEQGRIVTNTLIPPYSDVEEPSLHLYSLNGKHLQSYYLSEPRVQMVTRGQYLITGGDKGTLSIRDLNTLKSEYVLHLHEEITSLCLIENETHLLAGLASGKLIVVVVELHK